MNDERAITDGDRFEDSDKRQGNRVIRITGTGTARRGRPVWKYEVEVAELNPTTIGRSGSLLETTLRRRYRRISR